MPDLDPQPLTAQNVETRMRQFNAAYMAIYGPTIEPFGEAKATVAKAAHIIREARVALSRLQTSRFPQLDAEVTALVGRLTVELKRLEAL